MIGRPWNVARLLLACCFAFTTPLAPGQEPVAGKGVAIERIFGPELPGPYKHPACFTDLANGDLFLVYYAGTGEYADDTAVWGARLRAGAAQWERPSIIADAPGRSEGNAVIWQAADGTVWLYYVVRYGPTWANSRILAKLSRDGAQTWSDPIIVAFDEGMMVRSRPLALAGGGHLLPIYHEVGDDIEAVGTGSSSLFLRYDPKLHQWQETNRVFARRGCIQPAVARVEGDYLVAYCRRGGDYGPTTDGWLVRTESRDDGRTWSPGEESKFPNPNAAVDFIRLANGHLLLVYNDSMTERTPLTVALSTDGDRTYPIRQNIAEGDGDFGYPTALQTADGRIHVLFTSNERSVIRRASFGEADLIAAAKQE